MTMTAHRKTQMLAGALLLAAAGIGLARKNTWRWPAAAIQSTPEPQDTIYAMFNAARAGDVKGYLDAYTGPLAATLRQALSETTEPSFSQYLKTSNADVKGIAVSDPEQLSNTEVKVRVEFVYQDRNQAQNMILEKSASGWKIVRADGDERLPTLIPYGTPVK